MNSEFPEWYQEVDLAPTADILTKRWEGIEKFTSSLTPTGTADVARIFYGFPAKDSELLTRLRGALQTSDPAFVVKGNDREIQVIAGAVLVHAMEAARLGDVAALATQCADAQGLRRRKTPRFAVARADRYIRERCAELRRREPVSAIALPTNFAADVAPVRQDTPPDAAAQAKAMKALADAVDGLAKSTAQTAENLMRAHRLRREEADILWWAFGGYSRDLNERFEVLPVPARPLVAAKELVDLIQIMPGPVSALALMDRVIFGESGSGRDTKLSIKKTVEAAPRTWLREWAQGKVGIEQYGDLCPTLLSAQRVAEGAGTGWVSGVENVTRVQMTASLTSLQLAIQAYDELRLLKVLVPK